MQINSPITYNYRTKFIYLQTLSIKMDLSKDRRSQHSIHSSRVSQSSTTIPDHIQVKRMQARLLMDHYNQKQQQKNRQYMNESSDKSSYGHYQQTLTSNYLSQQQSKRRRKQQIKQKLAQQYNEMIRFKQEKIHQQKQQTREQQKRNLEISPWGRDSKQDLIKSKRVQSQYGKELEMHLRLQEMQKYEQRVKERQAVEKYQRQQYEQNVNFDRNQLSQFRRKQEFQKRQNEILGISHRSGANNANNNPQSLADFTLLTNPYNQSTQLAKSDIRALKRRQQLLYGTGLQQQLRSQTISPTMNDRHNITYADQTQRSNERQYSQAGSNIDMMVRSEVYNPITNPIPYSYKNPNILRMLSMHNGG